MDSRLTEFDQVLVGGPRVKAADVQIGFAQLFPASCAARTAAVSVGTRWRHLGTGGYIGLLQEEKETKVMNILNITSYSVSFNKQTCRCYPDLSLN